MRGQRKNIINQISPSSKTIDVGKSVTLTASLTPSYATTTFTWGLAMYGEPYNFELTPSGSTAVLKANGAGSAYVVVETANGLQYVAIITAESRDATSLSLNYSSLHLQPDDLFQLTAEVLPQNTTSKLTLNQHILPQALTQVPILTDWMTEHALSLGKYALLIQMAVLSPTGQASRSPLLSKKMKH